jgi:hypothetical protein
MEKENRVPTAEEFLNDIRYVTYSLDEKLITFARIHVKEALEEADGEVPLPYSEGVLNCYPPERIK